MIPLLVVDFSTRLLFLLLESIDYKPAATAQLMSWIKLKASTGNFIPRFSHTSTVLNVKGVRPMMLVLGGADAYRKSIPPQISVYDPEESLWRSIPIKGTAPVSRTGHMACLDDSGDRLIVVGGVSAFGERLDTIDVLHGLRELKDLHWNELHDGQFRVQAKAKEYPASMTVPGWCGCDPHHDEHRWWGGGDVVPKRVENEFYSAHWTRYALRKDSAKLPPVSHSSLVLRSSTLFLFGGTINNGTLSNDLWSLNLHNFGTETLTPLVRTQSVEGEKKGSRHTVSTTLQGAHIAFTWTKLGCRGQVPPPRSSHTASMVDQNRMIVIGGILADADAADASSVYELDTNSLIWTKHIVHGLPSLAYHTATVIGRTGRILIFGGFVEGTAVNNVHVLDTQSWTAVEVNVQGDIPRPRGSHTASLLGDRLIISSGWSSSGELQDESYVMNHPYDSSGYMSSLGSDLLAAFDKEEASDVSFVVEGKIIYCHRVILACRSHQMREILCARDAPDVIDLGEKFHYPVFRAMLMYLYCDRVVINRENAKELGDLARLYGLEQLEAIAENCFHHASIPPSCLNSDLGWAVTNRTLSDVTVNVDGVDIPCHRVILMNRSAYFRAMLTSGLREQQENHVELHEIDKHIFDAVLKFIYTDSLESDAQLAFDLFCQCSIFRISSLQERTEQTLLSLVDDDNVVPLLEAADVYGSRLLRDRCMQYIHRYHANLNAAGVLSELSHRLQDEIAQQRRALGHFGYRLSAQDLAALEEKQQQENTYVDMEGSLCTKCSRPFVYVKNEWPTGTPTPKDQLHKYVRGLPLEYLDKSLDVQHSAGGQVASVRFKDIEYWTPRPYAQKQDAQQNAALACLHVVQCGTVLKH